MRHSAISKIDPDRYADTGFAVKDTPAGGERDAVRRDDAQNACGARPHGL